MGKTGKIVLAIFVLGVAVVLLWYFVSPLLVSNEVNEELVFPLSEQEETSQLDIKVGSSGALPVNIETSASNTSQVVASGIFVDADSFHKGEGSAQILESNGEYILRFEDFNVTNGPDLRVYLSSGDQPTDHESLGEYVDLGKLKGNIGNQNYVIPEDVNLEEYNSIVIYCKPFRVVFSTATLD